MYPWLLLSAILLLPVSGYVLIRFVWMRSGKKDDRKQANAWEPKKYRSADYSHYGWRVKLLGVNVAILSCILLISWRQAVPAEENNAEVLEWDDRIYEVPITEIQDKKPILQQSTVSKDALFKETELELIKKMELTPDPIETNSLDPSELFDDFDDLVDDETVSTTLPIDTLLYVGSDDRLSKLPQFVGGVPALGAYLAERLGHVKVYQDVEIQLLMVVEKDGSLSHVSILRGSSKYLDNLALKTVNQMPRWEPGERDNDPVRVKVILPLQLQAH